MYVAMLILPSHERGLCSHIQLSLIVAIPKRLQFHGHIDFPGPLRMPGLCTHIEVPVLQGA